MAGEEASRLRRRMQFFVVSLLDVGAKAVPVTLAIGRKGSAVRRDWPCARWGLARRQQKRWLAGYAAVFPL